VLGLTQTLCIFPPRLKMYNVTVMVCTIVYRRRGDPRHPVASCWSELFFHPLLHPRASRPLEGPKRQYGRSFGFSSCRGCSRPREPTAEANDRITGLLQLFIQQSPVVCRIAVIFSTEVQKYSRSYGLSFFFADNPPACIYPTTSFDSTLDETLTLTP
jgi:hypothetical protein